MGIDTAKFHVGQVIHHTLFDYRGVIVDVDPEFRVGLALDGREKRPAKTADTASPWYHVLVDGTADRTYVAEQNIEPDSSGRPVEHPDLIDYFENRTTQGYVKRAHKVN